MQPVGSAGGRRVRGEQYQVLKQGLAGIPRHQRAHLMYYLHCVCFLLELNHDNTINRWVRANRVHCRLSSTFGYQNISCYVTRKELACWCDPEEPCHTAIVRGLANAPETEAEEEAVEDKPPIIPEDL